MPENTPKTVHIKTFGCQMNVYDSGRMSQVLGKQGFRHSEDIRQADVVLINTCSIRENSENKVLSLLGQLKGLKKKHPEKIFGVTGCVGQRMGRALLQRVPYLDIVMGPDAIEKVGEIVDEVSRGDRKLLSTEFDTRKRIYSQPAVVPGQTKPSEFLTVMKGCDHFCTYCIVPFVRGREKSRPVAELIEDIRRYVESGTREITFLGQNINTYGKGTDEDLTHLIEAANEVEGLERIRYVTSHPRDLTEKMIEQFGTVTKLCPALHLPFQSGSDRILKRMGRLYTRSEYLKKIELLRKACPEIAMSGDIIVGFPGETESDLKETLSLLEDVSFAGVFHFKYSPRPGTRAFSYEDDVTNEVKSERLARTLGLANEIIERENKKLIGCTQRVLMEGPDKKGRCFMGRTPQSKIVHVGDVGPACIGKTIEVRITDSNASNLKGSFVAN